MMRDGPQILAHHLDDAAAAQLGDGAAGASRARGSLAQPGSVMPSASARLVMVDAVPITVQWPALRAMQPSISHQLLFA